GRDDRERATAEQARQAEHTRLMLALIEKRHEAGEKKDGHKLGVIGDVLDAFGVTPDVAIEKVRGMFSSGDAGFGVTLLQELGAVAREGL
ncbi:MAG: hypothetical protein AABY22_28435, partial [Nanoarchaeota archaeon]